MKLTKHTKDIIWLFALCAPLAYMSGLCDLLGYPITITLAFLGAIMVVAKDKAGKNNFEKLMGKSFTRKK